MALPEDLVNRALDAAGADHEIGNMEDGSRESKVALRHYGPVLRQLLCAAHWNMARKQAPMTLLADATGTTASVGSVVPLPWTYEYAWPIDCVRARFVPMNQAIVAPASPQGNLAVPGTPTMTGLSTIPAGQARLVPARFLVGTDFNYPPQLQQGPGGTQWWEIPGVSPSNRTVVLTNVASAQLVYTCLQIYPSLWDALFEAAFVAALAEKIAVPLSKDKKTGLVFRNSNIAIAKDCIRAARISDGNEAWSTVDHVPDFIRIRSAGAGRSSGLLGGGGAGCYGYGWDAYAFSDGSAF